MVHRRPAHRVRRGTEAVAPDARGRPARVEQGAGGPPMGGRATRRRGGRDRTRVSRSPATPVPESLEPEAARDFDDSLEAYERAKEALAAAAHPDDLQWVSRSLDDGRFALARLGRASQGRPLPNRRPPCFFDQRHGLSVGDAQWAPEGGAVRDVPVCAACDARIKDGLDPQARSSSRPRGAAYYDAGRSRRRGPAVGTGLGDVHAQRHADGHDALHSHVPPGRARLLRDGRLTGGGRRRGRRWRPGDSGGGRRRRWRGRRAATSARAGTSGAMPAAGTSAVGSTSRLLTDSCTGGSAHGAARSAATRLSARAGGAPLPDLPGQTSGSGSREPGRRRPRGVPGQRPSPA